MNEAHDLGFLREALGLARRGVGLASPNPCVGAVVVDREGKIAGRGWHQYAERDHAEVLALREAGNRAEGATLYINLEPCSHQGRTPPCADALIAAKVARVVAAMSDPNPKVKGAGFAKLREAGVQVTVAGEGDAKSEDFVKLRAEARHLNEAFAKYIRTSLPLVTLKAGMSVDGKIAPNTGTRQTISGEQSRAHAQELRHASDAIMVGVGTVETDNPLLTDRSHRPRRRPLVRVVIDSKLRTPLNSQLVLTAKGDLMIFCATQDESRKRQLEDKGVIVVPVDSQCDRVNLKQVCEHLGGMQISSVLLEGGARLNGSALAAGLVDKLFLYIAPIILGGHKAVPLVAGNIGDAPRLKNVQMHRVGEDVAIEGYLRDLYL